MMYFSEKTKADPKPAVGPRADPCCVKLHDSLSALTKELITHMQQTRDMTERTTQALESMAKNQERIADCEYKNFFFLKQKLA